MSVTQAFNVATVFDAVDSKDSERFISFFAEGAVFKMANHPPAEGKDAIKSLVDGIFGALEGLGHNVTDVIRQEQPSIVVANGEVTYFRKDGIQKSYPFSATYRLRPDGLIGNYQAYVDNHDLFD